MRVKGGVVTRRKHNKVLKATKGYRMTKGRLYKVSHEAFMHAGQYSKKHRRHRGADMRRLWITRINIALKNLGFKYKDFISKMKEQNIAVNRKVLSELAISDFAAFEKVVKAVLI